MIPFILGIIWFEQDNHNRTLINQLVSSLMWSFLCWMLFIQPPTIIYIAFGPINISEFCSVHTYARNSVIMYFFFIQNAIMICWYMFIFHTKKPTAIQDDYWKVFVNIWSFTFSGVSQFVYYYLPGRNPIHHYLCLGRYPNNSQYLAVKPNLPVALLGISSGLLYVFFRIRFYLYKNQNGLIHNVFYNKQQTTNI